MEDAINLLLSEPEAPVYDSYAVLWESTSTSDDNIDTELDFPTYLNFDEEPKTSYTENIPLHDLLDDLASKTFKDDQYLRLKVRRHCLWEDVLMKIDRLNAYDLSKRIRVQFVGEEAVDQGGPTRESFHLVNAHAWIYNISFNS